MSSENKIMQEGDVQKTHVEEASDYHMEKRIHPIRMIFPMPKVYGSVGGGGFVDNGIGHVSVSGSTATQFGLLIYFETGNEHWRSQFFDAEDISELLMFTDEESHVIVQYQCANSDNHIIKVFYDGVYVNRHWQQTGR